MSAYNNVGIFWDYENCAPSSSGSGYHLIDRIRQLSHQFGSVNIFKAYLQFPERTSPKLYSLRSELQACGVSLIDCPHNGKNSVDLMMIVDIMAFVKDSPAPATVILISGDRDFAYLLSTIRWRRYNVVLISNTFMTHDSLSNQANMTFDWQADVLKARNDTDLSRSSPSHTRRDTSTSTPGIHVALEFAEPVKQPLNNKTSLQSPPELRPPTSSDVIQSAVLHTPTSSAELSVRLDITSTYEDPVNEDSTGISHVSGLLSQIDDWVLTDHSPTTDKQALSVDEGTSLSPVFLSAQSSPEFVSSEVEGDIPSSPGYLLVLGESDDSMDSTSIGNCSGDHEHFEGCTLCLRSASATEPVCCVPVEDLACTLPTPTKQTSSKPEPTQLVNTIRSDTPRPGPASSKLNVMAQTFTPRYASTENSRISTPVPPVSVAKQDFSELIAVLNDLRLKGIAKPRFRAVAPLLLAKKRDVYQSAGVSQFKTYLQLAANMHIITIEHSKDGDGWITLCHKRESISSPTHMEQISRSSIITTPPLHPMFQDLIFVLNELRMSGEVESRFSTIVPRLLRRNRNVYETARTTKFKDYIKAAAEAGVVTVKEAGKGDGWVNLRDEFHPSHPEPPQPPSNLPQTGSPSSAFHSLISVLEHFRTKSCTRPWVSQVFAKLAWSGQTGIYEPAGVSTFKDYLTAAISAGIISIEGGDVSNSNTAVYLLDSKDFAGPETGPAPSSLDTLTTHGPTSGTAFEDLTHVLEELSHRNATEFLFSEVKPLVLARNPLVLVQAGVCTFSEYVLLAAKVGIVVAADLPIVDDGWVRLHRESGFPQQPPPKRGNLTNLERHPIENVARTWPVFHDLVLILQHLGASGESEFRFANVVPLLLKKNPDIYASAGVSKFRDYIGLALVSGIVSVRRMKDGDGWISLCNSRPGHNRTNNSSQSLSSSVERSHSSNETITPPISIPSMYRELVWLLRQLRNAGDSKPLCSSIAVAFERNPKLLARSFGPVGTTRFDQYAESARNAGIVILETRVGEERMYLCPAWEEGSFIALSDW